MCDRRNSIDDWQKNYRELNLCNGKIKFISDDDEDMIEIFYDDGMLIDVGKPTESNYYYITVVSSNDEKGWQYPLIEVEVRSKQDLVDKIQKTIFNLRQG